MKASIGIKHRVGHSMVTISTTTNWIYKQMVSLKKFEPYVVVWAKVDKNDFPLDNIHCINSMDGWKSLVQRFFSKISHSRIDLRFYEQTYIFRKMAISLLHSHFGPVGFSDLKVAQALNLPHITTFYGFDLSLLPKQEPVWKDKYAHLFSKCDLFLVEGSYMKKCLVELGCPESKVIVHHIGVDLDRIPFSPRKIGDEGEIRILAAATFTEKKGLPYAIEAFAIVKMRNVGLKLRFILIGDVPESNKHVSIRRFYNVKDEIMKVIEKYKIRDSVDLLGYVPYHRFVAESQKAHIFISPSVVASDGDTEGGAPVAITEMSASGMPIISTFHCDIPEVVIDGETGFLVSERDVEALADRLEYLVTHPEIWDTMGKKGISHIERNYNLPRQVEALEEIYMRLVISNKGM